MRHRVQADDVLSKLHHLLFGDPKLRERLEFLRAKAEKLEREAAAIERAEERRLRDAARHAARYAPPPEDD